MKRRQFLLWTMAGLASLPSLSWGRSAPILNLTTPLTNTSEKTTLETVRNAIVRAGQVKGWTIVDESDGKVTLKHVKGRHVAACDVTFDTKQFSIAINPMTTLLKGPDSVHPKYNQWIRNLNKQILFEFNFLSR